VTVEERMTKRKEKSTKPTPGSAIEARGIFSMVEPRAKRNGRHCEENEGFIGYYNIVFEYNVYISK
jgi:hypothetical protein